MYLLFVRYSQLSFVTLTLICERERIEEKEKECDRKQERKRETERKKETVQNDPGQIRMPYLG